MDEDAMERARRMQPELVRRLQDVPGILGIGVGRGRARGSIALRVLVRDQAAASVVPESVGDVDVIVEITGRLRAY
jgi:hypothetical protein